MLLLGLAELSSALEDPFSDGVEGMGLHLPLEDMARTTVRDVARARREAAALWSLGVGGEGKEGSDGDDAGTSSCLGFIETVDWKGAEAMCGKVQS